MDNRLELHSKLVELVGNTNVYFQPPASVQLSYPCVIYSIGSGEANYANNKLYKYVHKYELLFIYKRPTIDVIEKVMMDLPMCKFDRAYVTNNLNHYAFNIYF